MRSKRSTTARLVYLVHRSKYAVPSTFHNILRVRDGSDRRTNSPFIQTEIAAEYDLRCKPGT